MAIGIVKGLAAADDAPPIGFVWKSASPISPAAIFAGTTWSQLNGPGDHRRGRGLCKRVYRRSGKRHTYNQRNALAQSQREHLFGGRTYAYRYSHYSEYKQCWRNALYRYSCRQHHENNVQRWCA